MLICILVVLLGMDGEKISNVEKVPEGALAPFKPPVTGEFANGFKKIKKYTLNWLKIMSEAISETIFKKKNLKM